ncbi:hypothetical protein M569_02731, partial [Genlisea aurea]
FLFCFADYAMLELRAKRMAEEMGRSDECSWSQVPMRRSGEEDERIIQLAVESEGGIHGNGDWAVKLGINLFYSASLSRSPLYSKQMHYNAVVYVAFGRSGDAGRKSEGGGTRKRSSRSVVAGRWCGRVWTSGQAHPILLPSGAEDPHPAADDGKKRKKRTTTTTTTAVTKTKPSPPPPTTTSGRSLRRGNKRKKEDEPTLQEEFPLSNTWRRTRTSMKRDAAPPAKKAKKTHQTEDHKKKKNTNNKKAEDGGGDDDDDDDGDGDCWYGCEMEGCSMRFATKQELSLHERNVCPVKGCGKKFFSHKYLVQHRRVHVDDRPLKCPWKGCKMAFKWAWARTEHIRVHTGARPYVCTEAGCGQTFRFVSDFSRHKRKTGHTPKK